MATGYVKKNSRTFQGFSVDFKDMKRGAYLRSVDGEARERSERALDLGSREVVSHLVGSRPMLLKILPDLLLRLPKRQIFKLIGQLKSTILSTA